MGLDLGNLLQQYLGDGANLNAGRAVDDFDEVARNAPRSTMAQVEQLAAEAEKENPGIVERMGDFHGEHPTLVKTIGGAALATSSTAAWSRARNWHANWTTRATPAIRRR